MFRPVFQPDRSYRMKKTNIFKIIMLSTVLAASATALAGTIHGFVAIPASKTATLPNTIKLASPYTSRIDNNTANAISLSFLFPTPAGFTSISSATALTPAMLFTASSAAVFFL